MNSKWIFRWLFCCLLACTVLQAQTSSFLQKGFQHPPDSARPWVYWFWLNSNITREGITADLEAMKRVGIGGVLIMEVDQGAPRGPVAFMSAEWRELFKHVTREARRLGLEVNMNNDAGWNGSGGPWIKPEQSMQKVVWSETNLAGPGRFTVSLPQPPTVAGFYRDIALVAFPTPGNFRIEGIQGKSAVERQGIGPASTRQLPAEMVINRGSITNLSPLLGPSGQLTWDTPPGTWTVMRLGHTSTGVMNAPAPESGRGLECDKLSPQGIEAQWAGMMGPLIEDVGRNAGKVLVATHIDSWENGSQNWTARMREEFQARRGYDLFPFLPVYTGRVVDSLEISERFLWDLRQTISEMVVTNYAGHLRELAQRHGLRLSIEAYGGPCDDLTYAGQADEPMCEFWMGGAALETCKAMASAAHTYGKPLVGAESFTADDREKWLQHPASIKSLGDRAFCDGVNRFVFHRYAMQPWLNYAPGMAMGPWGLHYERTQTWWEQSRPWHEYLSRCQFLLRQGRFVADLCFLQPEESPQGFLPHQRQGYDYDNCTADVVLRRMAVKNGRIELPDGMSYRLLVLPNDRPITPRLLRGIKELVQNGATVLGAKPSKSPSLSGYPGCDLEVKKLADEMWADCDGQKVKEHRYGQGRVIWGYSPEEWLQKEGLPRDFSAPPFIRWIHRQVGDADIYFLANSLPQPAGVTLEFRVSGKQPEFWHPENGRIEPVATWEQAGAITRIPTRFEPSESVFVIFRPGSQRLDPVKSLAKDNLTIIPAPEQKAHLIINKAQYGVLDDPKRTRDVRAKLQAVVDGGELSFPVARMAEGDDPAFMVVKTLKVEYSVEGQTYKVSGQDPEELVLAVPSRTRQTAEIKGGSNGRLLLEAWQPGRYNLATASGRTWTAEVSSLPLPVEINGSWELYFPPGKGAPEKVTLPQLLSWSEHGDPGVKYFSGTATYFKTFEMPAMPPAANDWERHWYLDVGKVQVMAQVELNGHDLGQLWKPPYRVDVTRALKKGQNILKVKVVNLWPNRLVGDEQLPEDSSRNPDGTLKEWPGWVREGKPSPTGRLTFASWRLWKKDSALQESGLIGPVQLVPSQEIQFR